MIILIMICYNAQILEFTDVTPMTKIIIALTYSPKCSSCILNQFAFQINIKLTLIKDYLDNFDKWYRSYKMAHVFIMLGMFYLIYFFFIFIEYSFCLMQICANQIWNSFLQSHIFLLFCVFFITFFFLFMDYSLLFMRICANQQ